MALETLDIKDEKIKMINEEVPEITNGKFNDFIKEGIVLIDFFADWCMPCIMMTPIIEELSNQFKGKIKFGKINIDENRELAQKYNIVSIPSFIVFKDGEILEKFMGSISMEELNEKLEGLI